mgnify:CR=1 FL=1
MQMNQQASNKMDDQMDYNMGMGQDHGNVPMDVAEDVVMQSTPPMFWVHLDDNVRSIDHYCQMAL